MLEYFEPCLNLDSDADHNVMGAIVALKEAVDGKVLQKAVDELVVRFPYFYVKAAYRGDDIVAVPNELLSEGPIRVSGVETMKKR